MVLPGISGGTIAFVLGIYEKLLDEIQKIRFKQIKYLLNLVHFNKEERLKNRALLLDSQDWFFIFPLVLGSAFAIGFFVFIIPPFIAKYSLEFYSIIFSLILISLWSPFKKMKKNLKTFSLLFLSFSINFLIFYMFQEFSIVQKQASLALFLPTGFLVASTLLVPGISGSYILILLGLYESLLIVVKDLNLLFLSYFFLGVVLGLITMSHLMKKILQKYLHETLSIILGLILGSLYSFWSFLDVSFQNWSFFQLSNAWFLMPFLFCINYKILYRWFQKKLVI
ncbi:MAG: DUF368 domain-containing protein [Bdellovibrionales bacterium]